MNFGERLRALREGLGLSQDALSERTRTDDVDPITRVHISNLERGIHEPGAQTLKRIAAALGVQPGALLDETETEPQSLAGTEA